MMTKFSYLRKLLFPIILLLLFVWVGAVSYRAIQNKMYIWFPNYAWNSLLNVTYHNTGKYPKHIIFYFVDHFEPHGDASIMEQWSNEYPRIVTKHQDADGHYPQHTWFYEGNAFLVPEAESLRELCSRGLGEVELHFHHRNDNSATLKEKLTKVLDEFTKYGFLITKEEKPRIAFGFIHGNWALDNSTFKRGKNYCGVNGELRLLSELGCYGDFTFPALGQYSQPEKVNNIYYAFDDTLKPKSYNTGIDVEVGKKSNGDLIIFPGSLSINWKDWRHGVYPSIEDGNITEGNPPSPLRIDHWIHEGITVKGQPDWIFVKIFCHGAEETSLPILMGKELDDMYAYLELKYNDNRRFILHYATAREVYNIVKAAEAGKTGNPNNYRDYLIQPYQADGSVK